MTRRTRGDMREFERFLSENYISKRIEVSPDVFRDNFAEISLISKDNGENTYYEISENKALGPLHSFNAGMRIHLFTFKKS